MNSSKIASENSSFQNESMGYHFIDLENCDYIISDTLNETSKMMIIRRKSMDDNNNVHPYTNETIGSNTRDDSEFYHCNNCGRRILESEWEDSMYIYGQPLCPFCIFRNGDDLNDLN